MVPPSLAADKDYFGGYDYGARSGIVHVASSHIAPGKKQWTWGNHAFGCASPVVQRLGPRVSTTRSASTCRACSSRFVPLPPSTRACLLLRSYAWDRNLTDPDEAGRYVPYIELM